MEQVQAYKGLDGRLYDSEEEAGNADLEWVEDRIEEGIAKVMNQAENLDHGLHRKRPARIVTENRHEIKSIIAKYEAMLEPELAFGDMGPAR